MKNMAPRYSVGTAVKTLYWIQGPDKTGIEGGSIARVKEVKPSNRRKVGGRFVTEMPRYLLVWAGLELWSYEDNLENAPLSPMWDRKDYED